MMDYREEASRNILNKIRTKSLMGAVLLAFLSSTSCTVDGPNMTALYLLKNSAELDR